MGQSWKMTARPLAGGVRAAAFAWADGRISETMNYSRVPPERTAMAAPYRDAATKTTNKSEPQTVNPARQPYRVIFPRRFRIRGVCRSCS
jgi:hypothetical protein